MDAPPPYPGTGDEKGGPPPQSGYSAPYPQQGGPAPYPPQGGPGPYPQQGYPPQGYPPPGQQGYPPSSQGNTTVVMGQPTAVTTVIHQSYRDTPMSMQCPHCQATIVSGMQYETGTLTWLACVGLCVIGCDLGCCFIPFCVDACKDVIHTCPNCKQVLGRYNRI